MHAQGIITKKVTAQVLVIMKNSGSIKPYYQQCMYTINYCTAWGMLKHELKSCCSCSLCKLCNWIFQHNSDEFHSNQQFYIDCNLHENLISRTTTTTTSVSNNNNKRFIEIDWLIKFIKLLSRLVTEASKKYSVFLSTCHFAIASKLAQCHWPINLI